MNPCPKPTVGRIVHLAVSAQQHYAAIIVFVAPVNLGAVNLVFWGPNGEQDSISGVEFDETGKLPYSWHWPERAD